MMFQEGHNRARPGRHVVITNTALTHLWEFASYGASAHIPQTQWRMSTGFLYCRGWGDTWRVEDAVGHKHGSLTWVDPPETAYLEMAEIETWYSRWGLSKGGWFVTCPGRGLYLSPNEIRSQSFFQWNNPDAFVLLFDHTTMGPASLGFLLHRVESAAIGRFELTRKEVVDFTLEGASIESLTQAVNLLQKPGFPAARLWEAIKFRVPATPPPEIELATRMQGARRPDVGMHEASRNTSPASGPEYLPPKVLAYYRETWGFDPVTHRVKRGENSYYYETRLPLENDPALDHTGVQMVARVELDRDGKTHNRLGFARGDKEHMAECIHTAIYNATPEELAKFTPEDYELLVKSTKGCPAVLPPWEHFASLKSFAAGLVDRGVLAALFPQAGYTDNRNQDTQEWGLGGLYDLLINALHEVAPEILQPQVMERVGTIIEQAPVEWVKTHAEPLFTRYKIDLLLADTAYLASVNDVTLKKLLILFLYAYHGDHFGRVSKFAGRFLGQISDGDVFGELDLDTTQDLLGAIGTELVRQSRTVDIKIGLDGTPGKIFRKLMVREDSRLCNPSILRTFLELAGDILDVKAVFPFYYFDKTASDDFLSKLLETIFRIWEGDQHAYLGYLPYYLLGHFLLKGLDRGLLGRFLLLAPDKWLVDYLPHMNINFNVDSEYLDRPPRTRPDRLVRKKVLSLLPSSSWRVQSRVYKSPNERRKVDRKVTPEGGNPWTWFEHGTQLASLENQYDYFYEGFHKGERYHPWAWVGIGLARFHENDVEGAKSALEKVIPGVAQQLQFTRADARVLIVPREMPSDTASGYLEHLVTSSTVYRIRDLRFPWREIALEDALSHPGFIKWIEWNPEGMISDNGITIGYCAHGQQFAYNRVTHEIALGAITWWGHGWNGDTTG